MSNDNPKRPLLDWEKDWIQERGELHTIEGTKGYNALEQIQIMDNISKRYVREVVMKPQWVDKKMYWQWVGKQPRYDHDTLTIHVIPEPPTVKRLDYMHFGRLVVPFTMCIGVYDDDVYTPLHRSQMIELLGLACQ